MYNIIIRFKMSNAALFTVSLFQIGSSFVGKTSIANRFTNNIFNYTMLSTIGVETYTKEISHKGKILVLRYGTQKDKKDILIYQIN